MALRLALAGHVQRRFGGENYARVLTLALPAVGEQVLNMAVGLVDTFMVGHLGAEAVAAVGLANQAVLFVTMFFGAVATGVTALVARHVGAREPGAANSVLHQGFLLGALMGVIGTAVSMLFATPIMQALRAPAEVVAQGSSYLSISAIGFFLASWMFVGNAALRGAGDTRTAMTVMLVVNLVNILVAYVAIYGLGPVPPFGVAGSAMGAAAGRAVGGLIVVGLLLRGHRSLRLRLSRLWPDWGEIRRILNIGLPAGGEQMLMRLGQTTFAAVVAGLGTQAFAAHQLALQAESLSYMPGFGFAVAATTLTGQGLGAGDPERAVSDGYTAHRLALLSMSVMGALFFVFAAQILDVFIDDPAVVQMGVWPLRLVAFSQPALATAMVLAGGLRGAGDTRSTLVITGLGLWLVRVPLAFALTVPFGLVGAWLAMGADLNARGLAFLLRYRGGRWTHLRV